MTDRSIHREMPGLRITGKGSQSMCSVSHRSSTGRTGQVTSNQALAGVIGQMSAILR